MAIRTFENKHIHAWALERYSKSAVDCAEAFGEVAGWESTYLRGGAVNRLRPGVSDLDFLLFIENLSSQSLLELRHIHRSLKRKHWILGELVVSNEKEWTQRVPFSPSIMNIASERRWLKGKQIPELPRVSPAPQSLLPLAIENYFLSLRAARQAKKLDQANFVKFISKCISVSEGKSITLRERTSRAGLLAEAFLRLDELALKRLTFRIPTVPDSILELADSPTRREDERESNSEWVSFMRGRQPDYKLHCADFPSNFFILDGKYETTPLSSFFSTYLESLAYWSGSELPPVVFSPSLFEAHLEGLGPESDGFINLYRVPVHRRGEAAWLERMKDHHFFRVFERTLASLLLGPGEIASLPSAVLMRRWRELCRDLMTLSARQITSRPENLISRCELSKVRRFSAALSNENSFPRLSRCVLEVIEEGKDFLFSEFPAHFAESITPQ